MSLPQIILLSTVEQFRNNNNIPLAVSYEIEKVCDENSKIKESNLVTLIKIC